MDSPSLSEITTYSQDERIANYLKIKRNKEQTHAQEKQLERRDFFESHEINRNHKIFKIPGINIMKFTHKKIKFAFQPSLLYENISKTYLFYTSLRYLERYDKWEIRKEPMPAKPLCKKVTNGYEFIPDDIEALYLVICGIYKELKKWSEDEILYRRMKYERYRTGKLTYLDIDPIDHELYFSNEEIQAMMERKLRILNRMLPQPPKKNCSQLQT